MTDKTVLITGASSGIGHATAQHFHQQGWNVVATMRTPDDSDLHQLDKTLVTQLDVTDIDSIDSAVQAALDRFGAIDVLVNNAGYDTFGALEAIPRNAMVRQINTNLVGVLDVTRAVLPTMR
ncbi:MAG: SDR family NAD(P)-dependent oxidoreductase, partial [Ilumatobacter sp.]